MYERGLFIFRQDLRIRDNTALHEAVASCKTLLPVFIFDKPILDQFHQPDARVGFLLETVLWLQQQLRTRWSDLLIFHGVSTKLIPLLIQEYQIQAVFRNRSYGVWSQTRDLHLREVLHDRSISVHTYADYLLVEPHQVETRKVFTPFYHLRQWVAKTLPHETDLSFPRVVAYSWDAFRDVLLSDGSSETYRRIWATKPEVWSSLHAATLLGQLPIIWYDDTRNFPAQTTGTSMLSPYLRFGVVSPRQILNRIIDHMTSGTCRTPDTVMMDKKVFKNSFVSELAWREFWWHIAWYFPETKSVAFQEKRRHIQRQNREDWFVAWQEWRTGYPIVDAGMRQLKTIGRMHGRVRMIVASFLCKDLLIDWVRWEQHFANFLFDYDPAVNMGNRQWSASVGADPKPLRIFNPLLQSQKFDPDATYIKTRLPELAHVPAVQLHDPLTYTLPYVRPIVNHYETSKIAKEMYKGVKQEGLFG